MKKNSIIVLVILIAFLILIPNKMSLENWGSMTKAQDNPKTIDEAIADAIAEHEADPESHMGEGESIENHRVNDVIDHPAESIVPDKFNSNISQYFNSFVVPSTYDSLGNASQDGVGYVNILITNTTTQSSLAIPVGWLEGRQFPVEGFLSDIVFSWVKVSTISANAIIACGDDYDGFGLSLNATGWRFFIAIAGEVTYSDYITIPQGTMHTLRLFTDVLNDKFIVYLDGEKVVDMALPAGSDAMTYQFTLWANRISGVSGGQISISLYSVSVKIGGI